MAAKWTILPFPSASGPSTETVREALERHRSEDFLNVCQITLPGADTAADGKAGGQFALVVVMAEPPTLEAERDHSATNIDLRHEFAARLRAFFGGTG